MKKLLAMLLCAAIEFGAVPLFTACAKGGERNEYRITAELKENVQVGQSASVYIKSLIPEKMKVKLIIVDSFQEEYSPGALRYYVTGGRMEEWRYSPACCDKVVVSHFSEI